MILSRTELRSYSSFLTITLLSLFTISCMGPTAVDESESTATTTSTSGTTATSTSGSLADVTKNKPEGCPDRPDSRLSNLPFPYQVNANQIAYMSCASTQLTSPFFTFKAGAFDNFLPPTNNLGISENGLQLSQTFLDAYKKVAKTYNASFYQTKLKEALKCSPQPANAQIFLSVRNRNDLKGLKQPALIFTGQEITNQQKLILDNLSKDSFAEAFSVEENAVKNYFPKAGSAARNLISDIKYRIPETGSGANKRTFKTNSEYMGPGGGWLVLGFTKTPSETALGNTTYLFGYGTSDTSTDMYGTGYEFNFTTPVVGYADGVQVSTPYPQEVVTGISEFDTLKKTQTPNVSWSCSSVNEGKTYQFRIVLPQHRNQLTRIKDSSERGYRVVQACPKEDITVMNAAAKTTLHLARRFLPAREWEINIGERCIVPKAATAGCYDRADTASSSLSQGYPTVIYDTYFPTEEFPVKDSAGNIRKIAFDTCDGTNPNPTPGCAAYFSFCVRKTL